MKKSKVNAVVGQLKSAISTDGGTITLSPEEKVLLEYQKAVGQDINFPLKNLQFIPSEIPLYHFKELNREIIASQVHKLSKSMLAMGNIRPVIVTKMKYKSNTPKYFILDMQHGYKALLALNATEIPVVEIPIDSIPSLVETIAMLNSSSKSWQLKDYIVAWSNIHGDYKILQELQTKYDMEYSIVAGICSGVSLSSGITAAKGIKTGKFRIMNLEESEQKLQDINEILNLLPRMDRAASRYFILSLITLFNEVGYTRAKHRKLMKFVRDNKTTLKFALNNVMELKEFLMQAFC